MSLTLKQAEQDARDAARQVAMLMAQRNQLSIDIAHAQRVSQLAQIHLENIRAMQRAVIPMTDELQEVMG